MAAQTVSKPLNKVQNTGWGVLVHTSISVSYHDIVPCSYNEPPKHGAGNIFCPNWLKMFLSMENHERCWKSSKTSRNAEISHLKGIRNCLKHPRHEIPKLTFPVCNSREFRCSFLQTEKKEFMNIWGIYLENMEIF